MTVAGITVLGLPADQAVELTVFGPPQERRHLFLGVDQCGAVWVARVADRDRPFRKLGDLDAATARVAGLALTPVRHRQAVSRQHSLNMHVYSPERNGFRITRYGHGGHAGRAPACCATITVHMHTSDARAYGCCIGWSYGAIYANTPLDQDVAALPRGDSPTDDPQDCCQPI